MEEITQGETLLDLESVNNLSFDDMEEAPGFVTPPDGIYHLTLESAKLEKYTTKATPGKAAETKNRINHFFKIDKVYELSNANEQSPAPGSKFSVRFMVNENGLKFWKSQAKDILGDGVQGGNLTVSSVLQEMSSGAYNFKARIKQRTSPMKDAQGQPTGKNFTNLQIQVLSHGDNVDNAAEGVNDAKAI